MGIRQWKLPDDDPARVRALAEKTGLPRLLCAVLAARGITDQEEIRRFTADSAALGDPFALAGMREAVDRIQAAVAGGERIAVYGDYDCDGITATALLTSYLQTVGADVLYYIPGRETEGYGLNNAAVDTLAGQGVDLIVTVDNGISAHGEIAYAATLGIDVVVTDHHTPRETLPPAVAVVNPHRADCPSPFKHLAGVGVAFKLVCALEGDDGSQLLEYYAELVALGTVADVVSLTGENRALVRDGLARLPRTGSPGLAALIQVSGLGGRAITSESAAFGLIPRINAAGRIGVADDVVELLLTDDDTFAAESAAAINEQNARRKQIEAEIIGQVDEMLARDPALLRRRLLILAGDGWHHGVVGIVAAKLLERTGKPVILFSREGGEVRGSGRSVEGFSLIEAVSACSRRLTRFGGHTLAAGMSLPAEFLDEFTAELEDYARRHHPVMPVPCLRADCALPPGELTVEGIGALAALEPCGAGNESPLFCLRGLTIEGVYPTQDGRHIRLRMSGGGLSFYAVYFGMTAQAFPYPAGSAVDAMARVGVGEYNGKPQLSVKLADVRPPDVPQQDIHLGRARYEAYLRGENTPGENAAITPTRDEIGAVYKYLRRQKEFPYGPDILYLRLLASGIEYCKMRLCLDILEEMGFLTCAATHGETAYRVVPDAPRADLSQSAVLHNLRAGTLVKEIERV